MSFQFLVYHSNTYFSGAPTSAGGNGLANSVVLYVRPMFNNWNLVGTLSQYDSIVSAYPDAQYELATNFK